MADPDMTSALQMFRRAANVLARLEDAVVFTGQAARARAADANSATAHLPPSGRSSAGSSPGLAGGRRHRTAHRHHRGFAEALGDAWWARYRIPWAARGQRPFRSVCGGARPALLHRRPDTQPGSLVLPQDRIIPFLGGGSLLRSSTLPPPAAWWWRSAARPSSSSSPRTSRSTSCR
jgi:hypothetical protein